MNKKDIKNILISMRTQSNESIVNNLLGEIDKKEESEIQKIIEQVGGTEELITAELKRKIESAIKRQQKRKEANDLLGRILSGSEEPVGEEQLKEVIEALREGQDNPINKFITYGISGQYVHLHLPGSLKTMVRTSGLTKTMNTMNMYLLDAIEKITQRKNRGDTVFKNCNQVYMLSPILIKQEIEFLDGIGFKTEINKVGVEDNSTKARIIKIIFDGHKSVGDVIKVGEATLDMERVATPEWQVKKKEIVEGFNQKGISIEETAVTGGRAEQ